MKLFLYYNYGSCNDGDHYCDVEEFTTMGDLTKRLHELIKMAMGDNYITYKIIVGTMIEDHL